MQYRRFGKLDFMVSALGFGCMRLPTLGDQTRIDEPLAIQMIRHGIDNGINYVDTAYPYHGGNSERVLGQALLGGYRQKVKLATKLPVPQVKQYADFDRFLNEQLVRLQTDHIDFYLLHGLSRRTWEFARDLGVIGWAEGAMRDGRIGHLGFSFHDDNSAFKYIVDGYDNWALSQVQYNYVDQTYQAGTEGVHYAASKGLAVVVMEPLMGGNLARPADEVKAVFDRAQRKRTAADWALQWVWNQPEITLALSGMSTMRHVEENLASADRSGGNTLADDDLEFIEAARKVHAALVVVHCTECRYCMPCPNGLDIPLNFQWLNRAVGLRQMFHSRYAYRNAHAASQLASACIACRECEEKCPQHIPISDWMPIVDNVLGKGADYDPKMAPVGNGGSI
ncbi:MAG: aldo/keto reductase [Chloroflexota bacterium]|nr:MAG: aldo/keto reductase [Chloroflexota bacterium]